jgi:hypothetical protein
MRRLLLVVSMVVLAGCNRDMFKPGAGTAAVAGSARLSSERLADYVGEAKGAQLNSETADFITNVWVDYSLFAQAVARGENLTDSATVAAAMWPQITELKATLWHDSLMSKRINITPDGVSQAYNGNDVRIFQHILVRASATGTPEEKAAARKQAQKAIATVKGGVPFSQVAPQVSSDQGSARDGGYLPPGPRGQFVPAFDTVAWNLAPGEMSGPVESQFGIHVIRRPPLTEVQDRLDQYLQARQVGILDSLYMDSLAAQKHLKIEADAPKLMKDAISNPDKDAKSAKALATYDGGKLSVQEFLRWARVLPPQVTGQLKTAPDSMLTRFARILATNVLLVNQADSAGIQPTAAQWAEMTQQYSLQLDTVKAHMDLGAAADSSGSEAERLKVAGTKVDAYMDQILTGAKRFTPLPASIAMVLREHNKVELSDPGVAKALEIGRARQAAKDSTSAKDSAAGPAPTGMQPAPGPAPVPPAPAPGN